MTLTHDALSMVSAQREESDDPDQTYVYSGPCDRVVRPFCLEYVGRVVRRRTIAAIKNDFGQDAFLYRGGPDCRHRWNRIPKDGEWGALADTEQRLPGEEEMVAEVMQRRIASCQRRAQYEFEVDHLLDVLEAGPLYSFGDWPNPAVPAGEPGAYTVWHGATLVYAKASSDVRRLAGMPVASPTTKGLYKALASHAAARGAQEPLLAYVRRTLGTTVSPITPADVRQFVHTALGYRFVAVPHDCAVDLYERIEQGALRCGRPTR